MAILYSVIFYIYVGLIVGLALKSYFGEFLKIEPILAKIGVK